MEDPALTIASLDRGRHRRRIFDQVIVNDDAIGDVEWTFSIDTAIPHGGRSPYTNRARSGCFWTQSLRVLPAFPLSVVAEPDRALG